MSETLEITEILKLLMYNSHWKVFSFGKMIIKMVK